MIRTAKTKNRRRRRCGCSVSIRPIQVECLPSECPPEKPTPSTDAVLQRADLDSTKRLCAIGFGVFSAPSQCIQLKRSARIATVSIGARLVGDRELDERGERESDACPRYVRLKYLPFSKSRPSVELLINKSSSLQKKVVSKFRVEKRARRRTLKF